MPDPEPPAQLPPDVSAPAKNRLAQLERDVEWFREQHAKVHEELALERQRHERELERLLGELANAEREIDTALGLFHAARAVLK